MHADVRSIAVTIATRGRPEGCRLLVAAVLTQDIPQDWTLRVIVVDNHPGGSGLELPTDVRLQVLSEPEPGIPFARNRGVEAALPSAEVICFVDDDEVPSDDTWLRTLVEGLDRWEADVVSGPVRPVFPSGTPSWIAEHPVLRRPRRPSGQALQETYTANTAVRSTVFAGGLRFDPAFRNTGGSDTQLFHEAHRAGARIRWVEEATVEETIPAERARVHWILARSFRIGANRVQFLRAASSPDRPRWIKTVSGSAAELLLGIVAIPVALFSRKYGLRLLGRAARGLGTFAALLGIRYRAYR